MLVSINFQSGMRQIRTQGRKANTTTKTYHNSSICKTVFIFLLQVCHQEFPLGGMVCKNNLTRFIHWISIIYRRSLEAINY